MKKIRFVTALLLAVMLFALTAGAFVSSAADGDAAPAEKSIFSPYESFVLLAGKKSDNNATSHGQNQTRMVTVPSGTYFSILTDMWNASDGLHYLISLIRRNHDGTYELLSTFDVIGVSTTGTIMADKDGNVWVYSGYCVDNGPFLFNVWLYDVATGEITCYSSRQKLKTGGGYSCACIDAECGKIYGMTGGDKYFNWCEFDIATRTWGTANGVKTNERYCYHYAYGDGKGGFFDVAERDALNTMVYSNIEDLRISDAMKQFRSRSQEPDYVWDEGHLLIIPNATVAELDNRKIDPVAYDVEKGLYPQWWNSSCDAFLDKNTGFFYVLGHQSDNRGEYGRHDNLFVYDTNDNMKEVRREDLFFLDGANVDYEHRFAQDTKGNIYMIATKNDTNCIEIWRKAPDLNAPFKLVYDGVIPGGFVFLSSPIVATNRNNSILSDKLEVIAYEKTTWEWAYFTIDLTLLDD